jgi:Uma2 family endonuclease
MTEILPKSFTYEDYLNLPDDGNRYELIEGRLFVTPPPITAHQYASMRLLVSLSGVIRARKLGVAYHAPYEIHLSNTNTIVQPDILFIRAENAPTADDPYFAGIPDLLVEILSEGTQSADTHVKFGVYESAGVPEYWIVDPRIKSVAVYTLEEGEYHLRVHAVGDEIITSRVLDGLEIRNSSIFL